MKDIHGYGVYHWTDGCVYEGQWAKQQMDGEGIFKYPDGRRYEGGYLKSQKHGNGKLSWPDGRVYEVGMWKVSLKRHARASSRRVRCMAMGPCWKRMAHGRTFSFEWSSEAFRPPFRPPFWLKIWRNADLRPWQRLGASPSWLTSHLAASHPQATLRKRVNDLLQQKSGIKALLRREGPWLWA